jgi:hypothetical protein
VSSGTDEDPRSLAENVDEFVEIAGGHDEALRGG